MPSALDRRHVLVALAGLVTGCANRASPGTDPETDVPTATATETWRETDRSTPGTGTGHGRRVTIEAVPVSRSKIARDVARPLSSFADADASVLETALADGSVRTTTDVDARFDTPVYVRTDGRYYRVEQSVLEARDVTGQQFRLWTLTCEGRGGAVESEVERAKTDAVAFSDLPTVDREAVPKFVRESMAAAAECFEAGWTASYPDTEARDDSRLLDAETTYVSFDDRYYRVDYLGENTVTEREYQYTATAVAASSAEFETVVDEHVVTHLDATDLSSGEEETLRTVLDRGAASWEHPVPPAVDDLAAQLEDERYVEWEGEYFAVEVRELVA